MPHRVVELDAVMYSKEQDHLDYVSVSNDADKILYLFLGVNRSITSKTKLLQIQYKQETLSTKEGR